MIVDVERVFTVDSATRSIEVRYPGAKPVTIDTLASSLASGAFRSIHMARGIGRLDFGLFVSVIDGDCADQESFLVTQTLKKGRGILTPSDEVIAEPALHITRELARKIAVLDTGELDQFELGSLSTYVNRRYPSMGTR